MLRWGRLSDLIDNVKGLSYDSALFFVFSNDEIQEFAIELNTGAPNNSQYGQLFLHGVDANGTPLTSIGGGYAPITKDLKRFDGLPIDHVTLYQDGDFYRSWRFIQTKDGFFLRADTLKEGVDLTDRWGDDIIGLNNDSIQAIIEAILPEVINYTLREILQ